MFSGFHVTRPTRKDASGKAVAYTAGMTPRDGADGVKKNGKGEAVDLFVSYIELPETVDDVVTMLKDPKWLEPTERVSYGYDDETKATADDDGEIKKNVAPIVALLVNSLKLAMNAEVNGRIAPKGLIKANRGRAELHWVENDQAGYVAMIVASKGDAKVKDKALDEYFAANLAE
jgi:hypothetical protein